MTLTEGSADYFLCCSFFPALLGAEMRRKPDRFPRRSYPSTAKNLSLYLHPPLLLPGASLAEPAPLSRSPRQPARTGRPRCRRSPRLGGNFGEGENPGSANSSSTTRSEPDVFLAPLLLLFLLLILLRSKQKRGTYIGLFNFSC